MIVQARKAHTKAWEILLGSGMQENRKSFNQTTRSSRFQEPSLFRAADTTLNLHYPISYSAAACRYYCDTPHCKQNTAISLNTPSQFYFTNQYSIVQIAP